MVQVIINSSAVDVIPSWLKLVIHSLWMLCCAVRLWHCVWRTLGLNAVAWRQTSCFFCVKTATVHSFISHHLTAVLQQIFVNTCENDLYALLLFSLLYTMDGKPVLSCEVLMVCIMTWRVLCVRYIYTLYMYVFIIKISSERKVLFIGTVNSRCSGQLWPTPNIKAEVV